MHFEHQAAFDLIRREGGHRSACHRLIDVGVQPLNNQGAGLVVASRSANGIDKSLVVVHKRRHMLRGPRIHIRTGFVGASKNQTFVVVLELICNLRPISFHFVVDGVIDARANIALEPAAFTFVVNVQNRVETCAHGEVDHGLHGIEPGFGNLAAARVAVPGTGNTDRVEAGCLDGIHQVLRRVGVAPAGRIIRHFHRVADVETQTHVGLDFLGGGECRCGRRKGSCESDEGGFSKNTLHFRSFFLVSP